MKMIIALIVTLAAPVVATAQSAPEAKPKDQLTDFAQRVIAHSNPAAIPKQLAKRFGMPDENYDDLLFYPIKTKRDDGSQAVTFVKPRATGHIDIFFIVETSFSDKYFFHTSEDGKLIKAEQVPFGQSGPMPMANNDAQKAFEHEKTSWLEYVKTK